MKHCPKCCRDLDESQFHRNRAKRDGLAIHCRKCFSDIDRQRYGDGRLKGEQSRAWYAANKARKRATGTDWNKANIERRREIGRRSQRKRRAADAMFRVSQSVSTCVRRMLNGWKGRASWQGIVGYTVDDLRAHIESLFVHGMTWENFGTVWEIDHIKPVSSFRCADKETAIVNVRECWALSNLRPLDGVANKKKGARIAA